MIRTLTISIGLYLVFSIGISTWIYQNAFQAELASDRVRGEVRLAETVSRLRGQLDVYRALANIIVGDPELELTLEKGPDDEAEKKLSQLSLTYGARAIDLVDRSGAVVASSNPAQTARAFSARLVRAALNGRLGSDQAVEGGQRLFRFSRGVRSSAGEMVGAIIISTDLASLEFEWPVSPEPLVFLDAGGLVFSANRPELLLLSAGGGTDGPPLPLYQIESAGSRGLWRYEVGGAKEVQVLQRFVPHLDLTAGILLDTVDARTTAQLRTMLAAASLLALGLIGTILMQQRRRLALESRHTATLEDRVESRTAELHAAQHELVEASKLAALGRLSAGISHELNQPLATILNFAENGRRFLERGKPQKATENLGEIANQVRRITRIIENLRAFARQEISPTGLIDLTQVTTDALGLLEKDLAKSDIQMTKQLPDAPAYVLAGKVRLEQVVLNLIANAKDAMQTTKNRSLTVSLTTSDDTAVLLVSDTGTGIEEPDRVFEPFYTTKELGASKGLGMGLALSYGIITRFGGQLSCRNTENGAQFSLTLPLIEPTDDL